MIQVIYLRDLEKWLSRVEKMNTKNYKLKTENNRLIFTTSSFKAEKTSVLHSGVYSREFSSILFASAACIVTYILTQSMSKELVVIRYIILVSVLIIAFLGSKKLIFKERYLEAHFNRSEKKVNIIRSGILTKKIETIPFANIKSVDLGSKKFVPENIDGINFVKRISLQHGSSVPGLGDIEEYITLSLRLTDGSERIIYAGKIEVGKINGEPYIPLKEIRSFLRNSSHR